MHFEMHNISVTLLCGMEIALCHSFLRGQPQVVTAETEFLAGRDKDPFFRLRRSPSPPPETCRDRTGRDRDDMPGDTVVTRKLWFVDCLLCSEIRRVDAHHEWEWQRAVLPEMDKRGGLLDKKIHDVTVKLPTGEAKLE